MVVIDITKRANRLGITQETKLIDQTMLSDCQVICEKTDFKVGYINNTQKRRDHFLKLFERLDWLELDQWIRFCCESLWNDNVEENYSEKFEKKIEEEGKKKNMDHLKNLKFTSGKQTWYASLIGCYGALKEYLVAAHEGRKLVFAIAIEGGKIS